MSRRAQLAWIFALTWVAYAAFYLCRKNLSVLLPALERNAGFAPASLANLVFIYSLAYAMGQFVLGPLSDRYGARVVVSLGMALCALSNIALAFTTSLPLWIALQFLNGFGQASGWSGLLKIMTNWFTRGHRGVVMAFWSSNYVVGAFYATVFGTWAATGPLASRFGWQTGLWLPGALLLVAAVVFAAGVRNGPHSDGAHTIAPRVPVREIISNPAVQILGAAYFCVKLTRYSLLFWLPLYMVQRLGYAQGEAGYTSSVFELAGFAGVLMAGFVSDHLFRSRRFPVAALMMAGLAAACLAQPLLASAGRWGNILGIALLGMMTFGPDTMIGGVAVQDSVKPHQTGTAAGFVNGLGSFGQIASPFVVAWVSEHLGWDFLFQIFVVLSLCGFVLLATRWKQPVPVPEETVVGI
jgi:sugar phosphate permease